MTTKKVLIAGSTLLADVFNTVSDALRLVSNNNSKNVLIRAYTYEDIDNMFSQGGGKQEKINRYIREDADYVIFVLEEEIGGVTKTEFDIAWETFMTQGRPGIYVYHRPAKIISPEIQEVIDKINDCHQYYTKYNDLEFLKLRVQVDFLKLINKLDIDIVDNLPTFSNDANIQPYKIRVNRPCRLEIDGDEIAVLDELKLTKISLPKGKYLRKVVAIDNNSLFDETEIEICETSKLDNIILSTTGLEDAKRDALPEGEFQVGDLMYKASENSGGVSVCGLINEGASEIHIPSQIQYGNYTYDVDSIGDNAFNLCFGLTSITIPNSVTSIGEFAFSFCSGLISITIPNSVTSIGKGAFFECSGLTSITIPNSVTCVGLGAFDGCSGLTSITIPNSVTSIGYYAFAHCSGLTSITIPNSVMIIGDEAFRGCSGLTSIKFPNSVTSIGDKAFSGCDALKYVKIPKTYIAIGKDAFPEHTQVIRE